AQGQLIACLAGRFQPHRGEYLLRALLLERERIRERLRDRLHGELMLVIPRTIDMAIHRAHGQGQRIRIGFLQLRNVLRHLATDIGADGFQDLLKILGDGHGQWMGAHDCVLWCPSMFFSGCFSDDACGTPARYLSPLREITSGTPPYTTPGGGCGDILRAMTYRGDGAQPAVAGSQSGEQSGTQPKATIYDVAHVAGVSPSTVSRAFTQPGRVSYKTAEKVRIAARQVGYG